LNNDQKLCAYNVRADPRTTLVIRALPCHHEAGISRGEEKQIAEIGDG
jgi:hypothetical protein